MDMRILGYTGFKITSVGMGTWAIGGDRWDKGWGAQDDQDSIEAIRQGRKLGMNWIDTAPVYGLGHSEEVVAQALQGIKESIFVFTKCGNLWEKGSTKLHRDLTRESMIEHVDDSLRRLKVDAIDLYQIHWPTDDLEEGWHALAELIKMGKIRYAGVCNCNLYQLQRLQRIHPVASLQNPYSLLERQAEKDILSFCAMNHIGFLAYSPLQTGLLTGKYTHATLSSLAENDWRRKGIHFTEPYLSANLSFIERLGTIAKKANLTLVQLAIAWVLSHAEVTAAIVGVRKKQHAIDAVAADGVVLGKDVLAEIEAISEKRTQALLESGVKLQE